MYPLLWGAGCGLTGNLAGALNDARHGRGRVGWIGVVVAAGVEQRLPRQVEKFR